MPCALNSSFIPQAIFESLLKDKVRLLLGLPLTLRDAATAYNALTYALQD
jgi:hypothetical protein